MDLADHLLKIIESEQEVLMEGPRCTGFFFGPHFEESYLRFKSDNVDKRYLRFMEAKGNDIERPVDKRDYLLGSDKRLKGYWHCHLDGDVLLIYHRNGSEIILDYVATHDEIKGKRVERLPFLK
jgi:mRNA-degrading endonuclease YafQ of YafQ-DinJ toxin-antitoxin module